MNFLADESVDRQIVQRLRQDGHGVLSIAETDPGITDEAVLDLANRNASILLTSDKDFGEMVFLKQRLSHGVILLRLAGLVPEVKASTTASAIRQHETEIPDSFSVITSRTIRIRHVRH
jgi:predicted nuclease of predicted toxin-antitoxin system